jgi:hypothetical protein
VTEEATNPASRHTDTKEMHQERLDLSFAASTAHVEANLADSDDERQYGLDKNP